MTVYTVHEPAVPPPDRLLRAEGVAFVKEGFAWIALLFPVLWLIFHRMWIELVVLICAALIVSLGLRWFGVHDELIGWASFALVLVFAFEANELRRWRLDRAGYRLVGAAAGKSRDAAELSFFREWVDAQPPAPAPGMLEAPASRGFIPSASGSSKSAEREDVIGFPA